MRGKFSFVYVDTWFGLTMCKFIVKNGSFKMLIVLLPIFVVDTKITFVYNVVSPLRIHWRLLTILKTSNVYVCSNVFLICKCIYIFCIYILTIHWYKTQMLKKFPSGKISVTKNAVLLLARAPTHLRLTFNL